MLYKHKLKQLAIYIISYLAFVHVLLDAMCELLYDVVFCLLNHFCFSLKPELFCWFKLSNINKRPVGISKSLPKIGITMESVGHMTQMLNTTFIHLCTPGVQKVKIHIGLWPFVIACCLLLCQAFVNGVNFGTNFYESLFRQIVNFASHSEYLEICSFKKRWTIWAPCTGWVWKNYTLMILIFFATRKCKSGQFVHIGLICSMFSYAF